MPRAGDLPMAQVGADDAVAHALPGGSVQTWPAPGNAGRTDLLRGHEPRRDLHRLWRRATTTSSPASTTTAPARAASRTSAATRSRRRCRTRRTPRRRTCGPSTTRSSSTAARTRSSISTLGPAAIRRTAPACSPSASRTSARATAKGLANAGITLASGLHLRRARPRARARRSAARRSSGGGGLGDIAGGATAVTFQVSVAAVGLRRRPAASSSARFTRPSRDDFGGSFTAGRLQGHRRSRRSRRRQLTKTPVSQGPVDPARRVTWTLDVRQHRRRGAAGRRRPGHAADRLRLRVELLVAVARRADRHPGHQHDRALERRDGRGEHALGRHDHDHRPRRRDHERDRHRRHARRSRTTRRLTGTAAAARRTPRARARRSTSRRSTSASARRSTTPSSPRCPGRATVHDDAALRATTRRSRTCA